MELSPSSSSEPVDFAAALGYGDSDRLVLDYDPSANVATYGDFAYRTVTQPGYVLERPASHRDGTMSDAMRCSGLHPAAVVNDTLRQL